MRMYKNKSWLKQQYLKLNKPIIKIAMEEGIHSCTIYYWLEKHKIPLKERTGKNNPFYGRNHTEEWKATASERKKKGQYVTCTTCGKIIWRMPSTLGEKNYCSRSCINTNRFYSNERRKSIGELMRGKMKGSKHWNWQDGKSFEPYCEKFNFEKKEEIRNQYNRVCVVSGISVLQNGRRLDVDHVNENKMQGWEGIKWLLVPLICKIHIKMRDPQNHLLLELLLLRNKNAEINYEFGDDINNGKDGVL